MPVHVIFQCYGNSNFQRKTGESIFYRPLLNKFINMDYTKFSKDSC